MVKRRGLGRGLDDLLATHDTDLPFLDTYGEADGTPEAGPPPSAGGDDSQELLSACVRLLRSEGADVDYNTEEEKAKVGTWLQLECVESGVSLTVCSDTPLPLVDSDLSEAGFEGGSLSDDRGNAEVIMTRWGVPLQRLLSRLCEFQS